MEGEESFLQPLRLNLKKPKDQCVLSETHVCVRDLSSVDIVDYDRDDVLFKQQNKGKPITLKKYFIVFMNIVLGC